MDLTTNTDLYRFRRGFTALLLVGALLLCNVAFWASHACSASQISSADSQVLEHYLSSETGVVDHEQQSGCYLRDATGYFAVLLTAFLGLILWLPFKGAPSWHTGIVSRPFYRLQSPIPRPPRGPQLILIQVFRL